MSQSRGIGCDDFRRLVHDLSRQRELDGATRRAANSHAHSCSVCAEILRRADSLTRALQELAGRSAAEQAPARVEAVLRAALLRRKRRSTKRWLSKLWLRPLPVSVAVALLLGLVGMSISRWGHLGDGGRPRSALRQARAAAPPPRVDLRAESGSRAFTGVLGPTVGSNQEEEDVSSFLALSFADSEVPLGDAQVVRVTLTGAALEALGFPVDEGLAQRRIAADVLLTEDGQARGIRIVSPEERAALSSPTEGKK